jgi:choline dehydrogenase
MSSAQIALEYDFVVCGSGSSGSVVAGRLTEHPDVSVLLLEAGGTDEVPEVIDASAWPANLGSERDWGFMAQSSEYLNGRSIALPMGKVLGGGSSINVMCWARGHKNDWDFFAAEAGDGSWNYEAVLDIYRRMEDWHGDPDARFRGKGGPAFVQPAPHPHPVSLAIVKGAESIGIPVFQSNNGIMMEGSGGAAIQDVCIRDGRRESAFRAYIAPGLERPNLTVLTHALVTRLAMVGSRAVGVEFRIGSTDYAVRAGSEVIVSLGAIHTPKLLMQSGIGDADELRRFGIPMTQHLPGVGRNYQDHGLVPCIWEYADPAPPDSCASESTVFWKSDPAVDSPDLHVCVVEIPFPNERIASNFDVPEHGFTMCVGLAKPTSRGRVRLTGPQPIDPVSIETNLLSDPGDVRAAVAGVELCREIAASDPLRPLIKRAVAPGNLTGSDLETFIRDATGIYSHQSCTAKMGTDPMSVVDHNLSVYGVERLRIADGSIMPRITTGNTMAPCMAIGERAAAIIKAANGL